MANLEDANIIPVPADQPAEEVDMPELPRMKVAIGRNGEVLVGDKEIKEARDPDAKEAGK